TCGPRVTCQRTSRSSASRSGSRKMPQACARAVWFERRNQGVFEERMSRWLDRPIVGALGGNALGFFRVTIDYPNGIAVFER
ncbi:MAG TPA: hypothetical protein VK864_01435, partial [Longimicrobiales bacterium]|nr:hypothetical protein [Longimicrobiales bacterium]